MNPYIEKVLVEIIQSTTTWRQWWWFSKKSII